ncbi:hypothetical protein SAMN03159463_05129 [Mesorhizobium sp. NFR06]|nr:hypothetical protein SAMN03159463_05129 [Mesorhizobium sp. NFR06]
MPSIGHVHLKGKKPLHRFAVFGLIATGQIIDKQTIVNGVSAKQDAVLLVEQSDRARRMTRQVKNAV